MLHPIWCQLNVPQVRTKGKRRCRNVMRMSIMMSHPESKSIESGNLKSSSLRMINMMMWELKATSRLTWELRITWITVKWMLAILRKGLLRILEWAKFVKSILRNLNWTWNRRNRRDINRTRKTINYHKLRHVGMLTIQSTFQSHSDNRKIILILFEQMRMKIKTTTMTKQ